MRGCRARRSRCSSLAGPEAEGRLRSGSVRIEGDAEIAQAFRNSCEQARPGRRGGAVARDRRRRGAPRRRTSRAESSPSADARRDSLATSAAEYLQEEGRDVPVRLEVEEFLQDVDRLRDDVERLEARIVRMEKAHQATGARLEVGARQQPAAASARSRCACASSADCSRSSACSCGTGSTTSSSPRTSSARCGSCSMSRPRRGSRRRTRRHAGRAASGSRSRSSGPIFVKFGQALSTRRDLLPADVADELAKLQDRVPPFPGGRGAGDRRARLRPAGRRGVRALRRDAARGGIDRAGPRGDAARRPGSRRQGAAARRARRRSSATSR